MRSTPFEICASVGDASALHARLLEAMPQRVWPNRRFDGCYTKINLMSNMTMDRGLHWTDFCHLRRRANAIPDAKTSAVVIRSCAHKRRKVFGHLYVCKFSSFLPFCGKFKILYKPRRELKQTFKTFKACPVNFWCSLSLKYTT